MPANQFSARQQELVSSLAARLGAIPGVEAIVLGGSHARGRARPESDIDLGLLYSEASPFEIERVREFASTVNDAPEPVVTGFYEYNATQQERRIVTPLGEVKKGVDDLWQQFNVTQGSLDGLKARPCQALLRVPAALERGRQRDRSRQTGRWVLPRPC